jgi:hypothetical protein
VSAETYELFSKEPPSGNLGFVDPKAKTLQLTVAGHDLTIHQSPTALSSNRAGGTTGAVLWKITPVFAEWMSRPENLFFASGVLSSQSSVIELGCGIAALNGLVLAPKVCRYVLTDQPYVAKLVEQNIEENFGVLSSKPASGVRGSKTLGRKMKGGAHDYPTPLLTFRELDWETDGVDPSLTGGDALRSFDAIIACDCIYNEALIEPFVQTCADICRLRVVDHAGMPPTLCIVGQQLRDADVFETFMNRFSRDFDIWRVPESRLVEGLRSNSGFVVHVGRLKNPL